MIDTPERTVRVEKWKVGYYYHFATGNKTYNRAEKKAEDIRNIEAGLSTNSTSDDEIIEGPLTNPDYYSWKTDLSTTETIPATYKTITENVEKTRTVRKQVGTKKVKKGTKKEVVKEGYWKYE